MSPNHQVNTNMATPTVLKEATLSFDSKGQANAITIDGKTFTGFPSGTYAVSPNESSGSLQVRVEIPAGDYRSASSVPAYTLFRHKSVSGQSDRISVSSHS
jgi:hypothetical protein